LTRPAEQGHVARLMDRLARLVLGHRLVFVLGTVLFTAGAGVLALRIRVDFTVQELFAEADPEIEYLREFNERFGPDDHLLLVLVEARDVFAPDVLRFVGELTRRAARLAGVRRVESLTTLSDLGNTEEGAIDTRPLFGQLPPDSGALAALRVRALASPLLGGRIVAKDRRLTAVAITLGDDVRRAKELERTVEGVERMVARVRPPAGCATRFSGVPYVRTEAVRLVRNDQLRFLPLGVLVTSLLLVLLYRSLYEVAVPMTAVSLSAGYTVSLMAALDAPIDILSNVLPLLVMVYGVADAVHLLGRIHEQQRRGEAREIAIRTAMRHLGVACLLTSGTTAIGFASLVAGSMTILHRFGLFAAAGVMIAYATTMVVAPLGVSLRRRPPAAVRFAHLAWLDRALVGIAAWVIRRPRGVLAASVALCVAAVGAGSQVEINNYLLGIYREGHPTQQATRLAEHKLEGVVRLQVSLEGKPGAMKDPAVLRAMHRLERWLEGQPGVTSTLSLATFVREMHRVVVGHAGIPGSRRGVAELLLMAEGEERLGRLVDYPYATGCVVAGMRDVGARRFLPLAREADRRARALFAPLGVVARATGTSLVAYRGINRLVYDLLRSLSVAFVVIAAVLALVFRSLWVGLLSLLPNIMPLAVGLGFMAVTGVRLEPATVIVFSIALGIAVDDTIHFLARYREELSGGAEPEQAVRTTMGTAGRAMVFTSLVLVTGFSVTLGSNFRGTANFGLVGMVILSTALVTDLLVTPACLLVLRPWSRRGS
jgi:predicted RND superfamily exporter protein